MKAAMRGATIGVAMIAIAGMASPAEARGNRRQDPNLDIPGPDFIHVLFLATLDGKEVAVGTEMQQGNVCVYQANSGGTMKKLGDMLFCGGRIVVPVGDWDYRVSVELYRPLKGDSYTLKIGSVEPVRTRYSGNYKSQKTAQPFTISLRENFSEAQMWADPTKGVLGYPLKTEFRVGEAMKGEIRLLVLPSDNYFAPPGSKWSSWSVIHFQHRDRQYFAEMLP
ncbi:exported hypothetical protein [uncultured Alphaproteobacteria bacterium]|uniref:Uncharacterized protein n=1 Tax=uncultured Alphaproteobacteria bacterium TaxID=91750 RepID=A0A212JMR5_9PROT|nr:exported hypothetical protein [uncultured Alphaproteobacteria bacterium]